ncbi:MAG: hypothetical protein ACPGSD_03665 [Flavobacteriales bacterium]
MLKKIIQIIILTGIITSVSAQEQKIKTKVKIGEEFKSSKKVYISKLFNSSEEGFYTLKLRYRRDDEIILNKFNSELKLIKENAIKFTKKEYQFTIDLKPSAQIFTSFRNNKHKIHYLFAHPFNESELSLNEPKKVMEIPFENSSVHNAGNFDYEISPDSNKILLYSNHPFKANEKEKFSFSVFDKELNLIWNKTVTFPYSDKLFSLQDFEIDNDGNLYILGKLYNDKVVEKRNGKPNYKYIILSYKNNGNVTKEYKVELENKFIRDLTFGINNQQDFVCAGFYSEKGTTSIKGSYYFEIDHESGKFLKENTKEFSPSFISKYKSERTKKKVKRKSKKGKAPELYEYDFDYLFMKDEGGALLIGEQYYSYTYSTTTTDANGNTTTHWHTRYVYGDIIVINIDKSGKTIWQEKIPKKQVVASYKATNYCSYYPIYRNNALYIVYNDNKKNLEFSEGQKLSNVTFGKNGIAAIAKLDEQGSMTKDFLFSQKETEFFVQPIMSEQISQNDLILYGRKRKKQKFSYLKILD